MPVIYRIVNWDGHFENNKSRERDSCSWCPLPNKQDGLGYGLIMQEEDGPAIYGAFVATVLMCSKQRKPRDGHLTDTGRADGRPLGAKEISVKTRIPAPVVQRMLDLTSSESIGWIHSATIGPAKCPPTALEGKGIEGNGREEKIITGEEAGDVPDRDSTASLKVPWRRDYAAAVVPQIEGYEDLSAIDDPVLAAMAVTGEHTKAGYGYWAPLLERALKKRKTITQESVEIICSIAKRAVERVYGENKTGECENVAAIMNLCLKNAL